MGRRSGFEGFLRATARAVAAAERERQRDIRVQLTQARQIERHQGSSSVLINIVGRSVSS